MNHVVMNWPPLPDEPLRPPPDPDGVQITKRKSPADYIDGYRAALIMTRIYLDEQIDLIDTAKKVAQEIVKNPEKP